MTQYETLRAVFISGPLLYASSNMLNEPVSISKSDALRLSFEWMADRMSKSYILCRGREWVIGVGIASGMECGIAIRLLNS